ncbi:MAG: hypothetical protein ACOCUS_02950, partial [Polyangiales bacterium]
MRLVSGTALAAVAVTLGLGLAGCASNECNFNSQCGRKHYCMAGTCRQDCTLDTDCTGDRQCNSIGRCVVDAVVRDAGPDARPPNDGGAMDSGSPPQDAGPPPQDSGSPEDSGSPPEDSGSPPEDSGSPPEDSGSPPGDGDYLDRCTGDGDCESGQCVEDLGTTSFCTRTCSTHAECAESQVCADDGTCRPDDTGAACSTGTPESCTMGLCLGAEGGTGECTRPCGDASDCPSGYACSTPAGSSMRVCMNIEKPCTADGSECASGLCSSDTGCTAT